MFEIFVKFRLSDAAFCEQSISFRTIKELKEELRSLGIKRMRKDEAFFDLSFTPIHRITKKWVQPSQTYLVKC